MAMSETVEIIEARKATIFVERKVSPKQYESLTVGLHLPVDMPERTEDDTDASYAAAIAAAVSQTTNLAKVQVYDALGIEYSDNNGVIAEKIAARVEGKVEAARPPRNVNPPPSYNDKAGAQDPTPASSGERACPKCQGAMWDNRQDKLPVAQGGKGRNPKGPDFKCKQSSCDGVFWPPKGK